MFFFKSLSSVWLFVTLWTIQYMEFSRPEYWSGYLALSRGSSQSMDWEPRSPALQADSSLDLSQKAEKRLQADSLPAEPQGKTKNTVVGSLSLLQGIFLI